MMDKTRVLFVCVHNSARSQMAEALLNHIAGDRFQAESAGLEPGKINPLAVAAMKQAGIDIPSHKTQSVFDVYKSTRLFSYVITVCDEASGERCPIFPGITKRLHWSFADPAAFTGPYEERLAQTIAVRDQIKGALEVWLKKMVDGQLQ